MKKLTFIIFLTLNFIFLQSQNLKKIVNKIEESKEIYHIDKITKNREGEYNYYYNEKLLLKGFYKNNKRDSVWTYYNDKDKVQCYAYFKLDIRDSFQIISKTLPEINNSEVINNCRIFFYNKQQERYGSETNSKINVEIVINEYGEIIDVMILSNIKNKDKNDFVIKTIFSRKLLRPYYSDKHIPEKIHFIIPLQIND